MRLPEVRETGPRFAKQDSRKVRWTSRQKRKALPAVNVQRQAEDGIVQMLML
jgi:hypothetical protein